MPPIRFDIWWSETDHKTVKVDSEQLVGEVVSEIKEQLGDRLPESDQTDTIIEYTLFKAVQGRREPILARKRTLAQTRIVEGELMYLANLRAPWWDQPSAATQHLNPQAAAQAVNVQPRACRIQLSAGYSLELAADGVQLSRNFLLTALPQQLVLLEQAKSFAGLPSRLQAVSREQHCAIVQQGAHWLLRAYAYTYVDGRGLSKGMTTMLARSTTIVLGHNGWPINVRLASS
ncbi:MAG: hypothetical protein M3R24_23835 [Chloroflexota bacterium]|nr:hypothetical protein [Chloroflexota bacterium]PLS76881.1 MAG: hypothetical protein CYG59_26820 [Chloroflexota bacterium]